MKKISELYDINDDTLVNDIKINSKEVKENDIFVCTMGVTADRHDFVEEAVKNGAKLIIASKKVDTNVRVIYVEDTNKELINLARKVYDFNDDNLDLIGVTGTNGKTTVALMIKNILGNDTGYIGTNGIISNTFNEQIRNTTPDADRLYKYFKRFTDDNCKKLVMETSSESFYRNRLDTLKFKIGVVTNVTQDHLNIHKTIENYVNCKVELVKNVSEDGFSILNVDDKYYELFKSNAKGKIYTYGKNESDLQIIDFKTYIDKTDITIKYKYQLYSFTSPYIGEANVYNMSASILACILLGNDIEKVLEKIPILPKIDGRFDFLNTDTNYKIMVDYAHTLDAFKNILPFLNEVKQNRLITVTGSAGGREKEKRGPMGKYVLENSDLVIFTMDDPRNEKVIDIVNDLIKDSDNTNYKIIEDRKDAINYAFDNAEENDIILIAGKGYDNYMAIGNEYLPYSDIDVINEYFNNK